MLLFLCDVASDFFKNKKHLTPAITNNFMFIVEVGCDPSFGIHGRRYRIVIVNLKAPVTYSDVRIAVKS